MPKRAAHSSRALAAMAAAAVLAAAAVSAEDITPQDVERAIQRGKESLLRSVDLRGDAGVGPCALAATALVNAGVSPEEPRVKAAIAYVVRNAMQQGSTQYVGCYIGGVTLMLLETTNSSEKDLAKRLAQRLVTFQQPRGDWGDFSRTQFAVLGLRSAERMGVEVPEAVWKAARRALEAGQSAGGGWGYGPGNPPRGSMTAAGITGLYIAGAALHEGSTRCGVHTADESLDRALAWMGANFAITHNPMAEGSWHYYYLYGLERIGVLTGMKEIGGHDWYREGAAYLVRAQRPGGEWASGEFCGDSFAMLFLGKGSAPVLVQKLKHSRGWNADPYDIPNIVDFVRADCGIQSSFQTVTTDAKALDLLAAPALYVTGHGRLELPGSFRAELARFLAEGGFLIGAACCGDEEFDRSFRELVAGLCPDSKMELLAPSHPVYIARHDLSARRDCHLLEGVQMGCRTAVLYTKAPVCCAWDGCMGPRRELRVAPEAARMLGVNMVSYVLAYRQLRSKLAEVELSVDSSGAGAKNEPPGGLVVGQVFHEGGWNPFPRTWQNLSRALAEKTGASSRIEARRVVPGKDDLFEFPLIYMTGYSPFRMVDDQLRAFRRYLEQGGQLIADPACGSRDFDKAFRGFVKELYPDGELVRLPLDHPVFRSAYRITKVEYKSPVLAESPGLDEPVLEALMLDGRPAIIYSPYNLGGELGGEGSALSRGYKHDDAFRVAMNIIVYAATQ